MIRRALIVDDERLARVVLRGLLTKHPEITIVGEADGNVTAAEAVRTLQPDVIFLDVQMPPETGFDLYDHVKIDADVVFVSAFDHYALRAFEVNALDYLLKPVTPERLADALARLASGKSTHTPLERLRLDDRICLSTTRGARFFVVEDIDLVKAAGDYAEVCLRDGNSLLSTQSIAHWEARLPDDFSRVHRSAIVNIMRIEEMLRSDGPTYAVRLVGRSEPIPVRRGLGPMMIAKFRRGMG